MRQFYFFGQNHSFTHQKVVKKLFLSKSIYIIDRDCTAKDCCPYDEIFVENSKQGKMHVSFVLVIKFAFEFCGRLVKNCNTYCCFICSLSFMLKKS